MQEEELIRILSEFGGGEDQSKREEAQSCIEENKEDPSFAMNLLSILIDPSKKGSIRFYCICTMNMFEINLPPENIYAIFPLLADSNYAFVISLSQYISRIIREEDLPVLLDCAPESVTGVLYTILRIAKREYRSGTLPDIIIEFCLAALDSSQDIWGPTIAAGILSTLRNPPEPLISKAVEMFQTPITGENFPFFNEMLDLFKFAPDDSEEVRSIVIQKLAEISELVPFGDPLVAPDGSSYDVSDLALSLVEYLSNILSDRYVKCEGGGEEESEMEVSFDDLKMELFPLMMKLCIHSQREDALLREDHEAFLNYSCFASGNFITEQSLRLACAEFIDTPSEFYEKAMELIAEDPCFMEPVYFTFGVHMFPNRSINTELAFDDPESEDILVQSNFIPLIARNGQLEDEQLAELLQSGDFNLTLMAARGVLLNEKYSNCIPVALEALYGLLEEIETSSIVELIEIIHSLTEKVPENAELVAPLLEQIVGLIQRFWSDYFVQTHVLDIVSSLTKKNENYPLLFEALLPVFTSCIEGEDSRLLGVELFGVLFARLPIDGVEAPDVSSYFPFFQQFYQEFDPKTIIKSSEGDDEDSNEADANYIFYPMCYFARIGLTEVIDASFMEMLHTLEVEHFLSLEFGSVLIALLTNSENKAEIATKLIQIIRESVEAESSEETKNDTRINTIAMIVSCFGYLVSLDRSATLEMLQGIDGAIPTIIESIAEKAPYITGRFDFLLIITLLFAICEDQSIPYSILEQYKTTLIFSFANGEEQSGIEPAYRFSMFDPLVANHPFMHYSIFAFFHLDFVLNENSPQFVHEFIQSKKIYFPDEGDEQIPFFGAL